MNSEAYAQKHFCKEMAIRLPQFLMTLCIHRRLNLNYHYVFWGFSVYQETHESHFKSNINNLALCNL